MHSRFARGIVRTIAASTLAVAVTVTYVSQFVPRASASFATVAFTTSDGTALTDYAVGDDLFVTVTDANRNTSATVAQSVELTVSTTKAGDVEPMTVANGRAATETDVNTGVFRNTKGYTTALLSGTVAINDGTLEVAQDDTIVISYADPSGEAETFDFSASPLAHKGYEGGHIDDGSSADDPTATSCADAPVYAGVESTIDFNTATDGGYIPTDRSKWDIQPGSKVGINDGPTTSSISSDNSTYESNKSITGGVTNPTGCHGWGLHEFDFSLAPYTAATLTELDPYWRGTATRATSGAEAASSNDLFLLAYNRAQTRWDKLDTEANIAELETSGPPFTNLTLSSAITANAADYVDSNGMLRLLVAEYSSTSSTTPTGGLYTDYVRMNVAGQDVTTASLTVAGGSILGKVFNDKNRDGKLDTGEAGLANVTITLLDGAGTVIVSDTSDSNGDFGFLGFPAGSYALQETDPKGFVSTTSNDIGPLTLVVGQTISDQNFGDAKSLSTTGLTGGYLVGTFVALFAGGLGLLLVAPRFRRVRPRS